MHFSSLQDDSDHGLHDDSDGDCVVDPAADSESEQDRTVQLRRIEFEKRRMRRELNKERRRRGNRAERNRR